MQTTENIFNTFKMGNSNMPYVVIMYYSKDNDLIGSCQNYTVTYSFII